MNTTDPTKPGFMWTKETIFNGVPERFEYIAVDSNGAVFAYKQSPHVEQYRWLDGCSARSIGAIGENIAPWAYDWQESLIRRTPDYSQWRGKLCWFWNNECAQTIGILVRHGSEEFYCLPTGGMQYRNCRPLTREEVEGLIFTETLEKEQQ